MNISLMSVGFRLGKEKESVQYFFKSYTVVVRDKYVIIMKLCKLEAYQGMWIPAYNYSYGAEFLVLKLQLNES